jgi:hypothetical protein
MLPKVSNNLDIAFKRTWLPIALPADELEQITDSPMSYLKELYPDIYKYGPYVDEWRKMMAELIAWLKNSPAASETLLSSLMCTYSDFYNSEYTSLVLNEYVPANYFQNDSLTKQVLGFIDENEFEFYELMDLLGSATGTTERASLRTALCVMSEIVLFQYFPHHNFASFEIIKQVHLEFCDSWQLSYPSTFL